MTEYFQMRSSCSTHSNSLIEAKNVIMESKSILDKLEDVERTINIYKNEEDPELIEEIAITISVEKLRTVVQPKDGDPLLYKGYILDPRQLDELNKELGDIIKPDYDLYYYVLECHGVYNW